MPKCNRIICTGTAPSHWAPYFINGDSEGMTPQDLQQADRFASWLGTTPMSCEDAGFMSSHDAMRVCGTLAADCQEYSALVELVPVLFRIGDAGDVTAVFPTIPGSPGFMSCYAHVGQHGSCCHDWLNSTRPATEAEYSDLMKELQGAPYWYPLKVYQRRAPWMERERQAAERRN